MQNTCACDVYVRSAISNYKKILKGDADGKKYPPVPVEEFAHYVKEMKAKDNYEFEKEYEVSLQIRNVNLRPVFDYQFLK